MFKMNRLYVEQVTFSSSMYFHATKKAEVQFVWGGSEQLKSTTYIDLGIYTLCLRNTLILEERSTLYFISTQSRDWTENLFYLPPQLPTSFHKKSTRLYLRLQELQDFKYSLSLRPSYLDIFVHLPLTNEKAQHLYFISTQTPDSNGNLILFATLHATTCSVRMLLVNKEKKGLKNKIFLL